MNRIKPVDNFKDCDATFIYETRIQKLTSVSCEMEPTVESSSSNGKEFFARN